MSIPQVKTPTLALAALWTTPADGRKISVAPCSQPKITRTLGLATEHHSADNTALTQSTTHNLDNANVIDVELQVEKARSAFCHPPMPSGQTYGLGLPGHDGEHGLRNELGKKILSSVLLGGECRSEGEDEALLGEGSLEGTDGKLYVRGASQRVVQSTQASTSSYSRAPPWHGHGRARSRGRPRRDAGPS